MTNGWANFKRIRLVFGKASPLMKTVVTAAIALSTVTLITLRLSQWDAQNTKQELLQRAAVLQQENAELREQIENLGTVESIQKIAREELGLVDPNTIIIDSE